MSKLEHGGMTQQVLCIIGVRGGSKRLKRKNIQKYGNTTLLEHAITNALKSKYIDKIVVDSEDNEILEISKKYPIDRHQREPSLSDDDVSLYIPVKRVLENYSNYDIIVILQVDCPVENYEIIDRCIETFINHDDSEDVSTFYNNRRTGTVRIIWKDQFFTGFPTANIYSVEDRNDFVDIHTKDDLDKANQYLKDKPHETFQVNNKIREPIEYNTRMICNHFFRYCKAIEKLNISENDIVIDASCGQGYGSYLLSQHAEMVYGIDINEKNIEKAKHFFSENLGLKFFTYNDYNLSWSWRKVDKIVCNETIEHIPKKELELFIGDILQYLKEDGDMFITCPLGEDKPSSHNKFHLNEPSIKTLTDMLSSHFKKTEIVISSFCNSYNKIQDYCTMSLYGKVVK